MGPERTRRWRLLAAALAMPAAAWLMLSGCGLSAQPGDGVEPAVATAGSAGVGLPLDAYLATDDQRAILDRAQRVLTTRCLARLGLPADTLPADALPADALRSDGRTADAGAAVPGHGQASATGRPRDVAVAAPVGGCVGEAMTMLADGAPRPTDPDVVAKLSADAHRRAESDSRVRAAVADFAACVQRAGPGQATPQPPAASPAASIARSPGAGDRQWAGAAAQRCREQTRVVAVLAAVESAYQARSIELNRGALATVKANLEARLSNAAGVTG
jgi:hypothetical protein